ncbi:MAG: protein TolB [Proteobacteria bacterium]|nr:protein TolB [Pseudomonadota bacterium]
MNNSIAADRVYLDISAPEIRKINIAVPLFQNKSLNDQKQHLDKDLADILGQALQFHGIISILPFEKYGGSQAADWKRLGSDYTILGQYAISANALKLEMRLQDVAGDEIVIGKTFSGSIDQKNQMLFKFCDNVIEALTGKPGIAATQIVFVNRDNTIKEVFLTDILGKSLRQITRHKHLTVSPRFIPGGLFLSYTSYHSGNQNLYITDLRQDKTTQALSRRKGLNLAPSWSADGEKMILTLSKDGNPDLYLLDRKGEIIEQLTNRSGINVSPAWSPDGSTVVFVSDRTGKPQLFALDMRTRGVRRLTFEGTENAEPSWSPTENLIVYSSLRDGVYQLFTMNPLTGASPKQLTHNLSHHEAPSWSPDGNQVIFAKRDGNKQAIYGIMKNGSFERKLFSFPGSQTYPQWSR